MSQPTWVPHAGAGWEQGRGPRIDAGAGARRDADAGAWDGMQVGELRPDASPFVNFKLIFRQHSCRTNGYN